jgi:hypothetical protein
MYLAGLIIIMEILPLLCDDVFFFLLSYSVICSCAIVGNVHVYFCPLITVNLQYKKKTLNQEMGFFIYIYFFSLYVLNSYLLFVHQQPVFCTFDQILVFLFISLLYTYINCSSFFFFLSSICPLIKIHS